ncbi:MAG: hypothetical protein ACXVA9_02790 [Bdellovibrionales bacterium]
MKNMIIVAAALFASSVAFAGVTTPDNFSATTSHSISMLDGGTLYSGFISVEVDGSRYAIKLEKDGKLSALNQRIYEILKKVIAGEIKLKQIHTFDDQSMTAGDFSYKVIAAVNVSN